MPKLELRFEKSVLGEFPVGDRPLTIGRAPDNDIVIDNLAVGALHARIFLQEDRYMLEDIESLNGTFVNNRRVQQRTILRDGDIIGIGKHNLIFYQYAEAPVSAVPPRKVAAPKIDETFVLETKKRVELLKDPTEATAVSRRVPVAHLRVLQGKTDQDEYVLTSKLTLIGKSDMASIKLRGWFKPKTAGVITRKEDGYYVAPASTKLNIRVNGTPIRTSQRIHDGDIIEISGIKFIFSLPS